MKRPPRTKITIRVTPETYEFLESRAIAWDRTIAKFTEDMVTQGVETERDNEKKPDWLAPKDRTETKQAMEKMRKEKQAAIDKYERMQIKKGNYAYPPMDSINAFKKSQRELKKIEAAKAMGIEPPQYDGSAWNEYFKSHGVEIPSRLKELQNTTPSTHQDNAPDAPPSGQDQATEAGQNT